MKLRKECENGTFSKNKNISLKQFEKAFMFLK